MRYRPRSSLAQPSAQALRRVRAPWARACAREPCRPRVPRPSRRPEPCRPQGSSWAHDLENLAGLVEAEPWTAGKDACRISVTNRAKEVGLHVGSCEELLVDAGVVETRHRPAIDAKRARRDDEIGALQRAIPKRGGLTQFRVLEPILRTGIVREEPGNEFRKLEVVTDDRGRGRRHDFLDVAWEQMWLEPF